LIRVFMKTPSVSSSFVFIEGLRLYYRSRPQLFPALAKRHLTSGEALLRYLQEAYQWCNQGCSGGLRTGGVPAIIALSERVITGQSANSESSAALHTHPVPPLLHLLF
jgi:hypothetical protein